MKKRSAAATLKRLAWRDRSLGIMRLSNGRRMRLTLGLGSGLARRPGDPKGTVWSIADRGPNLKIKTAIKFYGLDHLRHLKKVDGAKIMPRPDIGPAICQLRLDGNSVRLVRRIPLRGASGRAISGLPIPSGTAKVEPAFDLEGAPLGTDPSSADTEAIVALSDGTFWVGDEYAPSLLHVGADGQVLQRWVPIGFEKVLKGADYVVKGVLPVLAGLRRMNRGFEALAASLDECWLYVVLQSPLAHPGVGAFKKARHVRIWKLDINTGAVAAQYLYPLDEPTSFERDRKGGDVELTDVKVCEAAAVGQDRLLLLERISQTTKIYSVELAPRWALPAAHLDHRTRPTLEQSSASGDAEDTVPVLTKKLVFSTEDTADIGSDMEGMVVLSPHELVLVNDNDFSVEGVRTRFWRLRFKNPLF